MGTMMNSQPERQKIYTTLKTKNEHGTTLTEGTVNEHGTISMEVMENAAQILWKKVKHQRNKVENLCQITSHKRCCLPLFLSPQKSSKLNSLYCYQNHQHNSRH